MLNELLPFICFSPVFLVTRRRCAASQASDSVLAPHGVVKSGDRGLSSERGQSFRVATPDDDHAALQSDSLSKTIWAIAKLHFSE